VEMRMGNTFFFLSTRMGNGEGRVAGPAGGEFFYFLYLFFTFFSKINTGFKNLQK
jgi:hypothetical protein